MNIQSKEFKVDGIKFYMEEYYAEGQGKIEIARTYLYILRNDLHKEPFGFMEDVLVSENLRREGIASELVKRIIWESKKRGCYKLICTTRHTKPEILEMYKKLGFRNHGLELRIDF